MRLVDLQPRWILKEGRRVGILYKTPKPRSDSDPSWLGTMFVRTPIDEQWKLFEEAGVKPDLVHPSNENAAWTPRDGAEQSRFETLTLTPSVHIVGYCHGFITNGEWRDT